MNDKVYQGILESLLFVSGSDGVSLKQISQTLEVPMDKAMTLIEIINDFYHDDSRGIQLIEADDRYYLTTKAEHADYLRALVTGNQRQKLSQASLETLAIVAYNQPMTRLEVEEVRGVKSDRPIQTLLSRGLIEEAGKKDVLGRPMMFKTSVDFLTYFGLKSIDELPPLTEQISELSFEDEEDLFFSKQS
ncbi:segregation and condensation protein B [Streptohalobacillus salinus]|uniref:Segregation and condensation protein B n=1 Tax=Streptohalobacillus salinus TaxID=621096 RepID=A0A2V3WCA9_9BACI|nr:SMC-Scp complex subunit ScpB [Streptohalobacillus salinus]PXW91702.1 segregation and condensation protein B [Streptohalobacillus salinus]